MASSTKIIYETKPWLTGEWNLSMNTADFNDCGCPDARNTPPERVNATDHGVSNYIQMGHSRSVSILFSLNPNDVYSASERTNHAAIIGWIKTADTVPIYLPIPLILIVFRTGSVVGFVGCAGYDNTTCLADLLTIDDDNFKPAGLGGTPTFSYNNPNASGTLSEQGTGDKNNHSILKMENGWGLDGFQISYHAQTSGFNAGFLYSLA